MKTPLECPKMHWGELSQCPYVKRLSMFSMKALPVASAFGQFSAVELGALELCLADVTGSFGLGKVVEVSLSLSLSAGQGVSGCCLVFPSVCTPRWPTP